MTSISNQPSPLHEARAQGLALLAMEADALARAKLQRRGRRHILSLFALAMTIFVLGCLLTTGSLFR